MESAAVKFAAATQKTVRTHAAAFADAIRGGDRRKIVKFLKKHPGAVHWELVPHSDTCVHVAVKAKQFGIIPLLQKHGADIDKPSSGGYPTLAWAEDGGEIAKLVALGAKLHDTRWTATPLMLSLAASNATKACALVDAGTDISLRDSRGWTALMHASMYQPHWHPKVTGNPQQAQIAQHILKQPGIPDGELQTCLLLAQLRKESEPVAQAIGQALERRDARRAAAQEQVRAERQAIMDACSTGTAQKTAVRRPLVLRKPG